MKKFVNGVILTLAMVMMIATQAQAYELQKFRLFKKIGYVKDGVRYIISIIVVAPVKNIKNEILCSNEFNVKTKILYRTTGNTYLKTTPEGFKFLNPNTDEAYEVTLLDEDLDYAIFERMDIAESKQTLSNEELQPLLDKYLLERDKCWSDVLSNWEEPPDIREIE